MKINIIGGGPAALYFSIIMKKASASHEINIYERNPADATYGFGVVFSDETLDHFLGYDEESFEEITRNFAHWDTIEVRYRDTAIRCGGHGFCGIARKKLLSILQDRALSLGVNLNFDTEITDVEPYREADLLVGADGVNSLVRKSYSDHFQPTIDFRKTKFVWLGTTQTFGPFTFIFRPNEHGWFYVHAYQYAEDGTTWIVETHEDTWHRAGLDTASEQETVAYFEAMYKEELDGHPLLANKSEWRNFPMIKNQNWHYENVVILGDAAHTAQFSIGSGTKIAMEGAAALAESLRAHKNVPDGLQAYQNARENEVGALQASAYVSLKWYENARRFNDMEPQQYVFNFLARTKGVTWDNLELRDPDYIHDVRQWFAETVREEGFDIPENNPPPPIFMPFQLRNLVLENRVVVSPMCQYSAEDGTPNKWHLVHLGSMAVGGAGLIFTEMTDVSREGRITHGCAGMYKDEHIDAWRDIVDFIHDTGASKVCMQLAHAGRKGSTKLPWKWSRPEDPLDQDGWEIISASAVPYYPYSPVPRAMSREDMIEVRDDFVKAAKRALQADFDMIELHMAHGYLLSSFITPLSNKRSDEYGGSLENRMRFPLEVFDAVRAAWPKEKPMSVRISATDWVDDEGITGEDAVEVARLLKEHGCDLINVSAGQTSPEAEPVYGRMFQTTFAEQIRNEADIATMAVGNITTADQVNTIIAAGRADLCALARPHLTDPHFTLRAAAQYGFEGQPWPDQYLAAKEQALREAEKAREVEKQLRREAKQRRFKERLMRERAAQQRHSK